MESPPKRVTRARAAAKGASSRVKTTKIVTAAAKAKSSASSAVSNTTSTSSKRKLRADEIDEEDIDELEQPHDLAKKPTRGRPRKAADVEDEPPATKRAVRARPVKKAVTLAAKDEPAPAKTARGRPRKTVETQHNVTDDGRQPSPPTTRTVRNRTVATKSTTNTARPTARKVVKFQEPDKENEDLSAAKGASAAGGMRARPARRAPVTTSRSTNSMASSSNKPLSPKKVTQIPVSKLDSSEDELAGGDTPLKRMQKQPVKPPSNLIISPRKLSSSAAATLDDPEDNTLTIDNAILDPPELGVSHLGSPARRMPSSPFKESMKSPARKMGPIQLPCSTMKSRGAASEQNRMSPSKSLLQSAAKRPQSPIKGLLFGSNGHNLHSSSPSKVSVLKSPAKRALPGHQRLTSPDKTLNTGFDATPRMHTIMSSPSSTSTRKPSEKVLEDLVIEEDEDENKIDDVFTGPLSSLKFPGRLSAILSRDVDPTEADSFNEEDPADVAEADVAEAFLPEDMATDHDHMDQTEQTEHDEMANFGSEHSSGNGGNDQAILGTQNADEEPEPAARSNVPASPVYQLRAKDLDPCHDMNWESEDDLSPTKGADLMTPSFAKSPSKSRRITMGLSSLADQLDSWSPADPIVQHLGYSDTAFTAEDETAGEETSAGASPPSTSSPLDGPNAFFEQEISSRDSLITTELQTFSADNHVLEEPILEDMMVTDEDLELANEANEMSLKEPVLMDHDSFERSFSDDVSEASQDYADENQVPIDPALAGAANTVLLTPVRPAPKVFNTTTKVPLKPADYSTPSPVKKRSFSASRVAPRRPGGPTRHATVISYQPTTTDAATASRDEPSAAEPSTPAKSDMWASMGTPARTPRRNVNPEMLQGAVVFVDVHTSEGADASGIFVDLLNQMGARCVKTWNWSPDAEGSAAKCGITHVVFKDGGKRTMERVRQAKGIVHCVGVTWVLDCERENKWLDEASYYIERSFIPRGGARRRKSMEPKTLANMNGTLISGDYDKTGSAHDVQPSPQTPINRRQSAVWMYTPSDQEEDADDDDYEWSKFLMLTPVPKTPAPEAVARYAADIASTPGSEVPQSSPSYDDLLMRTCPPKSGKFRDVDAETPGRCPPRASTFEDLGAGLIGKQKDEHVRMRLMAAKRKSLQFAPKIGSPLARAWL